MSKFLSYSGLQRLWTNGWKTKFVPVTDQLAAPTLSGANAFIDDSTPTAITVSTSVSLVSGTTYSLSVLLTGALSCDLYIFFRCQGQPYTSGGNYGRTVVIPAGVTSFTYNEDVSAAANTSGVSVIGRGAATIDKIFDAEILNAGYLADRYTLTLSKSFLTRGDQQLFCMSITNPTFVSGTKKFTGSFTLRMISASSSTVGLISTSQLIVVRGAQSISGGGGTIKAYYSYNINATTGSSYWKAGTANNWTHEPTGTVLNRVYTRSLTSVTMSLLSSTSSYIDPSIPPGCCYMVFTATDITRKGKTVLFQRYYELQ